MKRNKKWPALNRINQALRSNRIQVEKLEDRVLLSADPLLQFEKPKAAEVVSSDNITLNLKDAAADPFAIAALAAKPDTKRVDLSQSQGTEQDSSILSWQQPGELLAINNSLKGLVVDLGDASSAATLSMELDGRLKISGANILDLIFKAPTDTLVISGGGGVDSLLFDMGSLSAMDLGAADLVIEAETIELGATQSLKGTGDFVFRGFAQISQSRTQAQYDLTLQADARVSLLGAVVTSGQVIMDARVQALGGLSGNASAVDLSLHAATSAIAMVGGQAKIEAGGLYVTAATSNQLSVSGQSFGNAGALGSLDLTARQTTRAIVESGATLVLGSGTNPPAMSLLLEAVDRSSFSTRLAVDDSATTGDDDLNRARSTISLERSAEAILLGREINVPAVDGAAASVRLQPVTASGKVQLSAVLADGASGGVRGVIDSDRFGQHATSTRDTVTVQVRDVDLSASAFSAYAQNQSSLLAQAKQASNEAAGLLSAVPAEGGSAQVLPSVSVLMANTHLTAAGLAQLIAVDASDLYALSDGLTADASLINKIDPLFASNVADRLAQVRVFDSTVSAGDLHIFAVNRAKLLAETREARLLSLTLAPSSSLTAIGATAASNQLTGGARALVDQSALTLGHDLRSGARMSSLVKSITPQGVPSGTASNIALGHSVGFNAVGWKWKSGTSPTQASTSSLLGSDGNFDSSPIEILARVNNTSVKAQGDVVVRADNAMKIVSLTGDLTAASGSSASGLLSLGASALLVSNRVRSETRAVVDGLDSAASSQSTQNFHIGGSLDIAALDSALVQANSDMSSGAGGGVALGALVARNDVRQVVDALLSRVSLRAAADVSLRASNSSSIQAVTQGEIGSSKSAAGMGLAMNALIATNMVLAKAHASIEHSDLYIEGHLRAHADNLARIDANNSAAMTANGFSAGVSLAYNTIGWSSQSVLGSSLESFIGSDLGTEIPAQTLATIVATRFTVLGDVSVRAGGGDNLKDPVGG